MSIPLSVFWNETALRELTPLGGCGGRQKREKNAQGGDLFSS